MILVEFLLSNSPRRKIPFNLADIFTILKNRLFGVIGFSPHFSPPEDTIHVQKTMMEKLELVEKEV